MRACPALGLVVLLGVAVVPPVRGQGADLEPVAIEGDLVVDKPVSYVGKHLKIRGNLVLAKGGELSLDNCVCELMCTYSREFLVQWRGGTLRTRNVTIGGSDHKGYMAQVNFELHDGLWEATDTTVRMSYGIVFSDKTVGRLRAKGFKAGVCPDSVILSGRGTRSWRTARSSSRSTSRRPEAAGSSWTSGRESPCRGSSTGRSCATPRRDWNSGTSRCHTSGGSSSTT